MLWVVFSPVVSEAMIYQNVDWNKRDLSRRTGGDCSSDALADVMQFGNVLAPWKSKALESYHSRLVTFAVIPPISISYVSVELLLPKCTQYDLLIGNVYDIWWLWLYLTA